MAKIELLSPIILKWEGKYVNDPLDAGGATNMGVTVATWKAVGYDKTGDNVINAEDIKVLSKEDFNRVLKQYWDRWRADEIQNQSLANILVDWVWGSGKWGIKIPQRILNLTDDGVVGNTTISVLNAQDAAILFDRIYRARVQFLNDIVTRKPSQKRFIKGWLNRLADFKFQP